MNKKKLTKIILFTIGSAILAVILILIGLGFKSIELNEKGIDYNRITGRYSQSIFGPGIYYIGVSNKFLKVKSGAVAVLFENIKCLSSDFIPVTLSAQVSYTFDLTDTSRVLQNYILFGDNPDDIIKPLMKNSIQKLISTYDLSTLKSFNITTFSSTLQTNIYNILNPLVPISISVTLQSITANYQNQTSSSYVALLKQQISKYRQDYSNLQPTISSDYLNMVQNLVLTTNSSLEGLITAEKQRLSMVSAWVSNVTSYTKIRNYLESSNQSFYQNTLAPTFITTGF